MNNFHHNMPHAWNGMPHMGPFEFVNNPAMSPPSPKSAGTLAGILIRSIDMVRDTVAKLVGFPSASDIATMQRAMELDPNRVSQLKIERYSFSLSPDAPFILGEPKGFDATLQPNTRIRATKVVMNAPSENFVLVDCLQVANVNVLVGTTEDAFTYSVRGEGVSLDLPTLDPANRATVSGTYTGYVPPGYAGPSTRQVNIGPEPPPMAPMKHDKTLYGKSKSEQRMARSEKIRLDREARVYKKNLAAYSAASHPDRFRDEQVQGFTFVFIVTFQGPSDLVGGLYTTRKS